MKGKKYILALLICMFFLASCASPLKKSLVNEEIPQFVGSITPITIPIQPEYQPVNMKLDTSLAIDLNFTLNAGSDKKIYSIYETEISMNVITNVKKLGDMLTWNTKLIELTENNQSLKPHIPLADCTLLTDKYGDIKESEISLPFFEQPQVRSEMGEAKLENMKKEWKEELKFSPTLPNTPVITGNNFIKARLFEALLESPIFEPFGKIIPPVEPVSIVKGWGYFEGIKVLVSAIDYVYEKLIEGDTALRIIINGYTLTNSENFMPVRSDLFFKAGIFGIPGFGRPGELLKKMWRKFEIKGEIPNDPSALGDFFIRARSIMSSKLEN